MNREIAPFGVRMPPGLKARIENSAHDNRRSMNAEIVARLEKSFDEAVEGPIADRLKKIEADLDHIKRLIKPDFDDEIPSYLISDK